MDTKTIKQSEIKRTWHLVDLEGQILGRQITKIAALLIGKGKVNYSPSQDMGDFVVVINSDKVKVTGKKMTDKLYQRHSGHPGGFRELTFSQMLDKDSRKIIEIAIKGMLPKNKLSDRRMARLRIFKDAAHNYQAELGIKKA